MDWNRGTLFEISGSYWKSCALHTGVKLEVFTLIGADQLSPETITEKIGGDLRGVMALLNALTAMELLEKTDGQFSNTDFAKQFLCKESPDYSGFIIMHHQHLMTYWEKLSESVISGKPNRANTSETEDEDERESFLMGMHVIASGTAPVYAGVVNLSGCTHLLDMGGGPGTYAIHFCQNNPNLKATVFDLPTTQQFAEKNIASFGLSERIQFKGGNFMEDTFDLDQDYDAVWLSHILHMEGPEGAESIVAKAASVLKPGGKLLIHEFILDNTLDAPLFPALFTLNMLIGTDRGQSYSEAQLQHMLENNGMTNIQRLSVKAPNDAGIMMGIKQGAVNRTDPALW